MTISRSICSLPELASANTAQVLLPSRARTSMRCTMPSAPGAVDTRMRSESVRCRSTAAVRSIAEASVRTFTASTAWARGAPNTTASRPTAAKTARKRRKIGTSRLRNPTSARPDQYRGGTAWASASALTKSVSTMRPKAAPRRCKRPVRKPRPVLFGGVKRRARSCRYAGSIPCAHARPPPPAAGRCCPSPA